jgi:hypothetical protein
MLGLVLVANDMSKQFILNSKEIFIQDFILGKSVEGYNFIRDIFLPLVVYLASIAGFFYLLIEDFKMLKTFSKSNKLARFVWTLWIIILICLLMIPIFFGFHLLMSGFALAVITTAVFLVIIAILYRLR